MFLVDETTGDIELVQGDSGTLYVEGIPDDKNYKVYFSIYNSNGKILGDEVWVYSYNLPTVTFEIPSDVSKVVIRYAAYNSSYPVKININDTIMPTSYATLAADEKNIPYATITMGSNKIVTIKTTESNKYASINYIAFYK